MEESCVRSFDAVVGSRVAEHKTDEPISVYIGECRLEAPTGTAVGTCEVYLDWLPTPRVRMGFNHALAGTSVLHFACGGVATLHTERFSVPVRHFSVGGSSDFVLNGFVEESVEWGTHAKAQYVVLELANGPWFSGRLPDQEFGSRYPSRTKLASDEWLAEVGQRADLKDIWFKGRRERGRALTHAAVVRRMDGAEFEYRDISKVIEWIGTHLSLANGGRCAAIVERGYNSHGNAVWERWPHAFVNEYRTCGSWLASDDPQMTSAWAASFTGFTRRAADAMWLKRFELALGAYAYTATSFDADVTAVFAQIGLTYLMDGDPVCSSLRQAAKKLTAYMRGASVNLDRTPLALAEFSKWYDIQRAAGGKDPESETYNVATALTRLRNWIEHPSKTNLLSLSSVPNRVRIEAMDIATNWLELALLHEIRYRGTFRNRLNDFEVESVPWM